MANYIDSLNKGLSAARDAERNKAEIDAIFKELNEQLAIATGGKIAIERLQFDDPGLSVSGALSSLFGRPKHWALAAVFLPSNTVVPVEIARWEQDNTGFPCRITLGKNNYSCEDKAGLEALLEVLLADPTVGEVLHGYMNRSEPEQ